MYDEHEPLNTGSVSSFDLCEVYALPVKSGTSPKLLLGIKLKHMYKDWKLMFLTSRWTEGFFESWWKEKI